MDIYHHATLVVGSSNTYTPIPSSAKAVLICNTGGAVSSAATVYPYGATSGVTFAAAIPMPANTSTIFPVKVGGASAATAVTVYALY